MTDQWLLVADEDPGFARVLQILIEEERPYSVRTAHTAQEAISALTADRPPTVVICELGMRGPEGISLISWLRRTHPEVPVLTTTAHPAAGSRNLANQLGVSAYLVQPVDPGELLTTVDRAMESAWVRRADTSNRHHHSPV